MLNRIFYIPLLVLCFSGATVGKGVAQEATGWVENDYDRNRLLASHKGIPEEGEDPLYLGWEIRLEEGWKTYWRSPGDAGQPPVIDWSGSVNLGEAELLFPFPEKFEIFGLHTYGYKNEVIYPIRVRPRVAGAPVTIRAKINYLTCSDLCVPEEVNFQLTIPSQEGPAPLSLNAGRIDHFLETVPEKGKTTSAFKISGNKASVTGQKGKLRILVEGENLMTGAQLIVENTEDFSFGVSEKQILPDASKAAFVVPFTRTTTAGQGGPGKITIVFTDGWGNYLEETITPEFN